MAFFDKQELIDQIRHEFRMEDDSGTCSRIVASERRRAKYGGLPLNFRQATSSDDDDDHGDAHYDYEIPLFEAPIHTRQVIEARLRSRTEESEDASGSQSVSENPKESIELFVPKEVDQRKENLLHRSAVSRFLEENGASMNNPLLEFARFEAVGKQASKTILVLYVTGEPSEDIERIKISVQPSAKVGEVIGYCLYRIFADKGSILSGNVEDYQLLMADDGGEIETDLPPLDRSRSIGDLGFTVLALVSKGNSTNGEAKPIHRVVVYLPSGHRFVFELDHLDHTLAWLRDETLKRRKVGVEDGPSGLIADLEYDLEDVNVFDKPLNLLQSIGNSGCLEFVLVRRFSSRGEFHPRGIMFRQKSTALLTPISRTSNSMSFDVNNGQMTPGELTCTSFERASEMLSTEEDGAIFSFRVSRLHRVKKNWPAIMSIRWDLFDIVPLASSRKSFLPRSYQKVISVPWTNLCDVKIVEQRTSEKPVLAITWLPVLRGETVPLVNEISLRLIAQSYENRTWKVVLVEFETTEKALQAKEHMVDVIRALNSPVYQAYQHSNDGSRSPCEAAEAVLMEMADGLLPAPSHRLQKGSAIKRLTRIGRVLTTRKLTL